MLKNIFTLCAICYFTFCKTASFPSLGTTIHYEFGPYKQFSFMLLYPQPCSESSFFCDNLWHYPSILTQPTNPPCCSWSSVCSETDYLNKIYIIFHVPEGTVGSVTSTPYGNAYDIRIVIADF